MYTDNALLFPRNVIPSLRTMRGQKWEALVDRVALLPECHEETLAFMLMMINLNGCAGCETDSYRAMKGCVGCAHQTIRRFKGTDEELLELFADALLQVQVFASKGTSISKMIQPEKNFVSINAL
jgi:hypothetical protein